MKKVFIAKVLSTVIWTVKCIAKVAAVTPVVM